MFAPQKISNSVTPWCGLSIFHIEIPLTASLKQLFCPAFPLNTVSHALQSSPPSSPGLRRPSRLRPAVWSSPTVVSASSRQKQNPWQIFTQGDDFRKTLKKRASSGFFMIASAFPSLFLHISKTLLLSVIKPKNIFHTLSKFHKMTNLLPKLGSIVKMLWQHCLLMPHRILFAGIMFVLPATGELVVTTSDDQLDVPAGSALSLREAIRDAAIGEKITFAPSLDGQTITLGQGGKGSEQLLIGKDLTVDASGLKNRPTINANGASRVIEISPGNTVTLNGLTLTGGVTPEVSAGTLNEAEGKGGAVFNNHSVVTLRDCIIYENTAYSSGGGIYNGGERGVIDSATMSLHDCVLFDNSAGGGGGGIQNGSWATGSSTLSLYNCSLYNNSAQWGDGIWNYGKGREYASLTLDGCTLNKHPGSAVMNSGNTALVLKNCSLCENLGHSISDSTNRGGNATIVLEGCSLSDNSDYAIMSSSFGTTTDLSLTRCTISGNSGGLEISAHFRGLATVNVDSSTITDNHGLGGIASNGTGGSVIVSLENTILASNTSAIGPDLREIGLATEASTTLIGKNIISDTSGNNGLGPGENLIVASPKLAPIDWYGGSTKTSPPLPGSPAIDGAVNSTASEDQRDFPIVSTADIGATEYQGSSDLNKFWPMDWDGDGNPFGVEYALGTDPLISDPTHVKNIVFTLDDSGNPLVTFGRAISSASGTVWSITRSPDLSADSFVEIFRFDGNTGTSTASDGEIGFTIEEEFISVTDKSLSSGKAFYRFEAILSP